MITELNSAFQQKEQESNFSPNLISYTKMMDPKGVCFNKT